MRQIFAATTTPVAPLLNPSCLPKVSLQGTRGDSTQGPRGSLFGEKHPSQLHFRGATGDATPHGFPIYPTIWHAQVSKPVVAIAGVVHGVCLFACNVFPVLHPGVLLLASTRHAVEGLSVCLPTSAATPITDNDDDDDDTRQQVAIRLYELTPSGEIIIRPCSGRRTRTTCNSQQGTRPPVFLPAFRNIGTTVCPKTQAFLLRP